MKKQRRVPRGKFVGPNGEVRYEQTYARTLDIDGIVYRRESKPKPKSRAERLAEATGQLDALGQQLQELAGDEDLTTEELVAKANELIGAIDYSEVETLLEEMREWRDNMDGANMSHLPKYEEVSDAFDALESLYDELESVSQDEFVASDAANTEELREVVRERGEELENAAANADVSFPRMF